MSSNQKVTPSAPAQQARYAANPYHVENHMNTHVRIGSDPFHVTTPPTSFVQAQAAQPPNQGPSMRASAPTGPPMQASTPPQSDMKVPQMAPQPNQLSMFPQQPTVRSPGAYYRTQPMPQAPRSSNHHRQPQMFSPHVQVFPNALGQPTMAVPINQLQMQYNQPRQSFYQSYSYIPSQPHMFGSYPGQQTQGPYFYPATQNTPHVNLTNRGGPPQSVATPGPQGNLQQSTPPLSAHVQTQSMARSTDTRRKSRKYAIPVIDPLTGKDVLDSSDADESPPPESGESSARETPQPNVSATFTMLVAQRASENDSVPTEAAANRVTDIVDDETSVLNKISKRIEPISPSESKLQVSTKEFIPEKANPQVLSSKEITPVVSANSDGAEVTISNTKSGKEKESPAKGRKQRENVAVQRADAARDSNRETVMSQHRSQSKEREVIQPMPSFPIKQDLAHREPIHPPPEIKEVTVSREVVTSVQLQEETLVPSVQIREPAPQVQHIQTPKEPVQVQSQLVPNPPKELPQQPVHRDVTPQHHENVSKSKSAGGKGKADQKQSSTQNNVAALIGADNPQQGKQKSNAVIIKSNKESSNKQSTVMPAPVAVNQKQQTQSSQPAAPISVPSSQPPKQSNRSNKMRELNRKGADKEGTDMDAFETNNVTSPPTFTDGTVITNVTVSDAPSEKKQSAKANDVSGGTKPEMKVLPKPTVDVTSIVRDVPRTMPVKPAPVFPTPQKEDVEKEPLSEQDKLVQAKNEVNSSENEEILQPNEPKAPLKLIYKEGRWSPSNPGGKKIYDRDFLYDLKNDPKSRKRPDNLPIDLTVPLKDINSRNRLADNRQFSNINKLQHEVLMPGFARSRSQRGQPLPKRNSQQGKDKSGKPVIHMSLSLREDVKLHESENAWRPARLKENADVLSEYDLKTQELYRKVRGVLNKLTPQKFDTLLTQVRGLNIDNCDRLQGVIDLVFEKAVDEPNFSKAYAFMCRELAVMQVPKNKISDDEVEYVNFRKLLITRCQLEFEKNNSAESARAERVKEIDAETDPEKKKELQMLLEEEDRRVRIKSVGNVRFIGELFKQQMLTVGIMLRCMKNLLDTIEEESLECLCKLLTTIGKDLEIEKKQNLAEFFAKMQEIVDKKHGKISSRVRFMLQDVIELRANRWVPRRQDLKPTTMDQIQKEAETEQMNIQMMNSGPINTMRKEERNNIPGGSSNSDRKRRGNVSLEDGWSTAPSRGSRTAYSVETQKLKSNKPASVDNVQLGSSQFFGNWGRGSNIKSQQASQQTSQSPSLGGLANMYAPLEHINPENDRVRPSTMPARNGNRDPYSSKGTSMERYKTSYDEERGSRSGSLARSRDVSQPRHQGPPVQQNTAPMSPATVPTQYSSEQLTTRVENILDEYINELVNEMECKSEIQSIFAPAAMPLFVSEVCNCVIERSEGARSSAGRLLAHLVKDGVITQQDCIAGLVDILSNVNDLVIDIPKIWDYLAEMIVPLITEDTLQLPILHKSCFPILIEQKHAGKMLVALFKRLSAEKGQAYVRDLWNKSQLQFSEFMPAGEVADFLKNNQLEYLESSNILPNIPSAPSGMPGTLGFEQIHSKLLQMFRNNTPRDEVIDWVKTNIGEKRTKDKEFIRALMTAVAEHSIVPPNNTGGALKLKVDILKSHYILLQRYLENTEAHELQCIYALQALVHKLEHPQGMLLEFFDQLWDDTILSTESFLTWEVCKNPAEQEGKGVALKTLASFFSAVKEVEQSGDEDDQASEGE